MIDEQPALPERNEPVDAPRPARQPVRWFDHLIGASLYATYVTIVVKTTRNLGYARDEGFYFRAAESYARWFEQLGANWRNAIQRSAVDGAWAANHEHPALLKSLFALSWTFFYRKLHWFAEEGTSFRFGGTVVAAGAIWLLYIWGTRARSRAVGLVAALLYALMPRVFYHMHLDCFDAPIATMWALCAYAYWRSIESRSVGWAIMTGVTFGLALDTKHNSWFLPFAFVAHAGLSRGLGIFRDLKAGVVRIPLAFVAMALIGPPLFVALWPWLWFDTAARFSGYVDFHMNHDYYNMVFLGTTYWKPPMPRGYIWLMTAATVPTITLVLFFVGFLGRAKAHLAAMLARIRPRSFPRTSLVRDPGHADLLWALGIAAPYAMWLSPNTPIFGGTKHWMTAYPFLCLFAGTGFEIVARALREAWASRVPMLARPALCEAALGAAVLAAPLVETVHSHPWGLSNYTPLVGGAPGAASLGLNRQFWGFTTGVETGFLNDHVPAGGQVYIHDTAWDSWDMLHRDGRLKPHVQATWLPHSSNFALYHHEDHMEGVEYQIWASYGTATPVDLGTYDGVPIIYVYARPGSTKH
jgi:hypothetical protein